MQIHATPNTHPEVVMLPLANVEEHPENPRKTFRKLEELAETIAQFGVLEPILTRPVKGGKYQIIFGARRFRASKIAKAQTIPAFVRVIEDDQAEKMMLIENGQRDDLHELEEAEAYERLRKVHGMSVEEIAAKVGKSPAVIYMRLKLCACCKKVREACYAGRITPSVALLIARIPNEKMQIDALADIEDEAKARAKTESYDEDAVTIKAADAKAVEPLSERIAFRIIRDRFMLRLVDAPFDISDAKLVAKAGACTTCPHRTGNQAQLFSDVKSADVCTLPTCFREKRDAEWKRRTASAKDTGVTVMPEAEAKKVFNSADGRVAWGADFVDLDAEGYIDGKNTTYRKKLGKDLPPITIARDREGGIHELVKKADVEKRPAPAKLTPAEKKRREEERSARKKENTKEAIEQRCTELAIHALVEKAEGKQPAADLWRALIVGVLTGHVSKTIAEALVARKLVKDEDEVYGLGPKGYARLVSKLSEKTCRGLFVEIIAVQSTYNDFGTRVELSEERNAFDMLCDFYKVDPKKFQAEAKASVGAGAKS